jgi:hypothetical protein
MVLAGDPSAAVGIRERAWDATLDVILREHNEPKDLEGSIDVSPGTKP